MGWKKAIWPLLALLGLMLAAWGYCRGGGETAHADGLGTGSYIMLVGTSGGAVTMERMYLIDTKAKVILCYQSQNNRGTHLVGGRTYDQDLAILEKHPELIFDPKRTEGWTARNIKEFYLKENPK